MKELRLQSVVYYSLPDLSIRLVSEQNSLDSWQSNRSCRIGGLLRDLAYLPSADVTRVVKPPGANKRSVFSKIAFGELVGVIAVNIAKAKRASEFDLAPEYIHRGLCRAPLPEKNVRIHLDRVREIRFAKHIGVL
jgi:hypothetical protein